MGKQKIVFILNSKFPTQKAFGITTRKTYDELIKNKYEVKIFCSKSKYLDRDFLNLTNSILNFKQNWIDNLSIFLGEKGSFRINQFFWLLGSMFRLKRNLKCIGKIEPNIIWTRDAWCAYLILKEFKDVKIVLEVHGRSNIIFYKFLKKYIDRIFFCPINEINRVYILNLLPRARVLIAPMGIDKHIVANKLQVKKFISSLKQRDISKIKIAYIGKFAPQGYSKGVEDLIYLAQKSQQRKSFTVTLLGATKKEEIEYLKLKDDLGISSRYLNIIKHVPHSMALRAMRDFDILVLPLPNNSIYQGMPIKLLEYFASGRVTILAESNLLKELFKFDFSPFFYKKHDSESLYQAIQEVLQCKDLEKKIQSCINFASKHTWEKRTKDIVDFISR